jgi:hypothetical protein
MVAESDEEQEPLIRQGASRSSGSPDDHEAALGKRECSEDNGHPSFLQEMLHAPFALSEWYSMLVDEYGYKLPFIVVCLATSDERCGQFFGF